MSDNKLILVDIVGTDVVKTEINEGNPYDNTPRIPINVEGKYLKLVNLNNAWVLTKRHNGNTFFKRREFVTNTKNYPLRDCIYYSKEDAERTLTELNSVRKKCKYKIENASKYFVNNYIGYSSWNELHVKNEALPIKKVNKDTKVGSIQDAHKFIIDICKQNVTAYENRIVSLQKELPQRIAEITKDYEQRIAQTTSDRNKYKLELAEIESINLEKISETYETQGDTMVKVLFAKNTNEHKS